jgi:peptide/nickel transport system substrate-binding protein
LLNPRETAVNRKTIADGLVSTFGGPSPTDQMALPGQDGYNNKTFYPYDPAKARVLLAQAGYPHGFTLPVLSQAGVTPLLEVLANDYKAIGVTLKITDAGTNLSKYIQDMSSGQFAAFGIAYGALPIHIMAPDLFLSGAFWNPFHDSDQQILSMYQQAAAADPSTQATLDQRLMARLTELAWFVPVLWQPVSFYARKNVTGLAVSRGRPIPDPAEWGFSD